MHMFNVKFTKHSKRRFLSVMSDFSTSDRDLLSFHYEIFFIDMKERKKAIFFYSKYCGCSGATTKPAEKILTKMIYKLAVSACDAGKFRFYVC